MSLVQLQFHSSSPYYDIQQQRKCEFSKIQIKWSCISIFRNIKFVIQLYHTTWAFLQLPFLAFLLTADLNCLSSFFRRSFSNVKDSMREAALHTSCFTVLDILCSVWFFGGCISHDCFWWRLLFLHRWASQLNWENVINIPTTAVFNSILLVPYNNIVSHTALGIPIKNPVDDITGSNACQSTITKKWNKNISLRIFTESKFWIWMQVFTLTVSVAIVHSVREQKTSVLCAWNWRNTDQGWGRGKGSCACSEKSEELEEIFSEIILQVSWGESKEKSQFVMSNPRSQKGFTV